MAAPLIAPSLMCMSLMNVERDIRVMDECFDLYHVDVMDGHFCPNMALAPAFANELRRVSRLPIDVHLMVENPAPFVGMLELGERDCLSFQAETIERNAFRLWGRVRERGCRFGVVLSPSTPLCAIDTICERIDLLTIMTVDTGFAGQSFIPEMLRKVRAARQLREERGCHFKIQLDGQCNRARFKTVAESGADILIVGSSGLFSLAPTLPEAIAEFKRQFCEETGIEL